VDVRLLDAGDGRDRRLRLGSRGVGLMLASLAFNSFETIWTIIWSTAKQRHVPAPLLGRVSSLDWLISIGLMPLSFALAAPISAAIGAANTLICAGVIGSVVTLAALFVPGVRSIEQRDDEQPPEARVRRLGHAQAGVTP
jgi:hypothetical protein